MATDKSLRTPPNKIIDSYVASIKKTFTDPETVPDKKFLESGTYAITYKSAVTVGGLTVVDGYSVSNPIGFDFTVNGKTYKEFSVAVAGWMMLRDPAGGSFGPTFYNDVINESGAPYFGTAQKIYTNDFLLSSFSYDHIVLAPWFDETWVTAQTAQELSASGLYTGILTAQVVSDINEGKNVENWPFDAVDHGVRYVNGYDSQRGKYLLVRWTNAEAYYRNKLKFEVAIYENGTIEYRYWPKKSYKPGNIMIPSATMSATVGAFWSGPTHGSNKFRDLSLFLDYDAQRASLEIGGSNNSSGYSEASLSYSISQPFSVNITGNNWPKNGAVISLVPETRLGKFLPKKIASLKNSSKNLVSKSGIFDDRKTVNFYSGSAQMLHMPSTLSTRLLGNSSDVNVSAKQLLFTTGSLKVKGSTRKHIVDSNIEALNIIEAGSVSTDMSFNESTLSTLSTSSFYATGSSLESFGAGFTSPLKSKTQIRFSLPVTKQSVMPATTSSIYYYDEKRNSWSYVNPSHTGEIRDPLPMVADSSIPELGISDAQAYKHRVTETSRGFDAVGRKVAFGGFDVASTYSNLLGGTATPASIFQTDDSVGAIFNYSKTFGNPSFVNDAPAKIYSKSLPNNVDFYPSADQTLDFPTEYPFLIEKIVARIPLYISGSWFDDYTTCNRAFGDSGDAYKFPSGAIDFGGPGLTFALMCPRRVHNSCYIDLIASGTITHYMDNTSSVSFKKDADMGYYSMRPIGFKSFSNPSAVISGSGNIFEGTVELQMEAAVAGGLTLARNDRSLLPTDIPSNREHAITLLTTETFPVAGRNLGTDFVASQYNEYNQFDNNPAFYTLRAPRTYVQQISPLSRGATGVEFNGNSILGGNIATYNLESTINNKLYIAPSSSLPSDIKSKVDGAGFLFEAVTVYSTVDSRVAPYLIMPGDKLTLSISKTRPVIRKAVRTGGIPAFGGFGSRYESYHLTGSHGTVMLNTGSIDITIYGSYVREGTEYNP